MAAAQDAPEVRVGTDVPAWVEPLEVPASLETAEGGIEPLAQDVQWHVEQARATRFARTVYRVLTTSGVQDASELSIPVGSDETLEIHYVRRVRDGQVTELLRPDMVRVIQPEARLASGLYDGSRRALLFLEDTRVGDVLEHAHSRVRTNAVLSGRFARSELVGEARSRFTRFIARWPSARGIQARAHDADAQWVVTEAPGSIRLEARDYESRDFAPYAPMHHFHGMVLVEMSELPSWADVVAWALPHYSLDDAPLGDAVPLDRLRAAGDVPAQVVAALRFVQDEIRYLGLEAGADAVVPRAPSVVATRRYGDCKDKALLLVALLRAIGVEADVALVSTMRGHTLDDALPSPFAFDHVIVRAVVETAALVLRPGTTTLSSIPRVATGEPDIAVDEELHLLGDAATLRVRTLLRRAAARGVRATLDRDGLEALREAYRGSYLERGIEVEVVEPMTVEELDGGVVRIEERYRATWIWADGSHDVSAWPLYGYLPALHAERPEAPVELQYPLQVVHRFVAEHEDGWAIRNSSERMDSEHFSVRREVQVSRRELRIETRLTTLTAEVPADRVARYREEQERAATLLDYSITMDGPDEAEASRSSIAEMVTAGSCLGAIALFLVIGNLASRRMASQRARTFAKAQRGVPGESAAHGIAVLDRADAERRHQAPRCCGERVEGGEWASAQLAGSPLYVCASRCARCGTTHRRYYRQERTGA